MAGITEIRTRIDSVQQTLKITNAMYLISSLSDLFSVLLRQSAQAAASADYFHSIVCNCLRDRKHPFRRVNFTRLSVTACGTASSCFFESVSVDCL